MNELFMRRLQQERRQLEATLPRLRSFLEPVETFGEPPVTYVFRILPFGFVVRAGDAGPVESFDPLRHGELTLFLGLDPERYPWTPWQALLRGRSGIVVVNPHVSARAEGRGGICWIDPRLAFHPGDWPVYRVLPHVLRILAAEVWAPEGFNLQEEGKDWFVANRARLPFACIPVGPEEILVRNHGASVAGGSALGIEIEGEQP